MKRTLIYFFILIVISSNMIILGDAQSSSIDPLYEQFLFDSTRMWHKEIYGSVAKHYTLLNSSLTALETDYSYVWTKSLDYAYTYDSASSSTHYSYMFVGAAMPLKDGILNLTWRYGSSSDYARIGLTISYSDTSYADILTITYLLYGSTKKISWIIKTPSGTTKASNDIYNTYSLNTNYTWIVSFKHNKLTFDDGLGHNYTLLSNIDVYKSDGVDFAKDLYPCIILRDYTSSTSTKWYYYNYYADIMTAGYNSVKFDINSKQKFLELNSTANGIQAQVYREMEIKSNIKTKIYFNFSNNFYFGIYGFDGFNYYWIFKLNKTILQLGNNFYNITEYKNYTLNETITSFDVKLDWSKSEFVFNIKQNDILIFYKSVNVLYWAQQMYFKIGGNDKFKIKLYSLNIKFKMIDWEITDNAKHPYAYYYDYSGSTAGDTESAIYQKYMYQFLGYRGIMHVATQKSSGVQNVHVNQTLYIDFYDGIQMNYVARIYIALRYIYFVTNSTDRYRTEVSIRQTYPTNVSLFGWSSYDSDYNYLMFKIWKTFESNSLAIAWKFTDNDFSNDNFTYYFSNITLSEYNLAIINIRDYIYWSGSGATSYSFQARLTFEQTELMSGAQGIAEPHFSTTFFLLSPIVFLGQIFINALNLIAGTIGALITVSASIVVSGLSVIIDSIGVNIVNTLNLINDWLSTAAQSIIDNFNIIGESVFNWFLNGISNLLSAIVDSIEVFINSIGILLGIDNLFDVLIDIFTFISNILSNILSFLEIISNIFGIVSYLFTFISNNYTGILSLAGLFLAFDFLNKVIINEDYEAWVSTYIKIFNFAVDISIRIIVAIINFVGGIIP